MAGWKQTFCIRCYVNCGLEVATEGSKITRVTASPHRPPVAATSTR
jgi:hypothetical protein